MVICLFCAAGTALAQAYRWTDENGVVHYSDRPTPGAEEFILPESTAPTRIIPPRGAADPVTGPVINPNPDEDEEEEPTGYENLTIISPAAEETLWNIAGNLTVQISLQPSLRRGHQIRVFFDGTPRLVGGTTFTLSDVFRGSHNLQVEVVDARGQIQIRTEPMQFYVQQTTINRPGGGGPVPR